MSVHMQTPSAHQPILTKSLVNIMEYGITSYVGLMPKNMAAIH